MGCEMHLLDQRSMVRLQDLIAKAAPWPVKTSCSGAKVCVPAAENPGMAHEQPKPPQNDAIRAEARALEDSVRAIRRAQGKRNPEDCVPGSAESSAVMEAFVRDVGRVLALDMLEREKGKDID
ncbi:hypothetical protein C7410_13427 [Paraburkholderia silvatlantica]|uniref:Uncharacterized protein n=1 Tax=Paraburkholderia silvatlantica TaxID=321895 RepID=A0A2V4TCK9_9BURK|nr:hypothetical protein C7410_13427 [Paraburkholderia silvatlantica]